MVVHFTSFVVWCDWNKWMNLYEFALWHFLHLYVFRCVYIIYFTLLTCLPTPTSFISIYVWGSVCNNDETFYFEHLNTLNMIMPKIGERRKIKRDGFRLWRNSKWFASILLRSRCSLFVVCSTMFFLLLLFCWWREETEPTLQIENVLQKNALKLMRLKLVVIAFELPLILNGSGTKVITYLIRWNNCILWSNRWTQFQLI